MTMLDSMRRHKVWLQWSLVLVVLAFIIAYIPTFVSSTGNASSGDTVAVVGGIAGQCDNHEGEDNKGGREELQEGHG